MARTTLGAPLAQAALPSEAAKMQPMPEDSSSAKWAGSTAASLLFSLDDAAEKLGSSVPESMQEYNPVLEVQRIKQACALSEPEQKLSLAVSEAKASSILTCGSVQLGHVGSYLRSKYGYLVAIRHANAARRPRSYLRMLRHSYLICKGLEGMEGADVLVDLNFKDHFILPHSTGWYVKLVAALPQDWIGTAAALAPIVGLMSAGIRLCFKQAGIPLPPWREGRAVLSKWVPELYEDEVLPLALLPDPALRRMLAPYHAPFRTALRTAGAVDQAVAAGMKAAATVTSSTQLYDQQQHASGGKPPLPRPPSGVALASASVKAAAGAAAGAVLAAPGSYTAAAGAGHAGHAQVVPDVPRKIIVGFPDQNMLPRAAVQHEIAAHRGDVYDSAAVGDEPDAGVLVTRHVVTSATTSLKQQEHQNHAHAHGLSHSAALQPAVGSAITAMLAQLAAGDATVRKGREAGGLNVLPLPEVVAAIPAKVIAATQQNSKPVVQKLQHQQFKTHQQSEQQPRRSSVARPAFTSTVGVVTATCGNSPGIVINQQWLQPVGGHAGVDTAGQKDHLATVRDASMTERQFKTLDQLLPRMRTVRLGAA